MGVREWGGYTVEFEDYLKEDQEGPSESQEVRKLRGSKFTSRKAFILRNRRSFKPPPCNSNSLRSFFMRLASLVAGGGG